MQGQRRAVTSPGQKQGVRGALVVGGMLVFMLSCCGGLSPRSATLILLALGTTLLAGSLRRRLSFVRDGWWKLPSTRVGLLLVLNIAYPWFPFFAPGFVVAVVLGLVFPFTIWTLALRSADSGDRVRVVASGAKFGVCAVFVVGFHGLLSLPSTQKCVATSFTGHWSAVRETLNGDFTYAGVAGPFSQEEASQIAACLGADPLSDDEILGRDEHGKWSTRRRRAYDGMVPAGSEPSIRAWESWVGDCLVAVDHSPSWTVAVSLCDWGL